MRGLALHREQDTHLLSANLRRAFSGIVAGNVKPETLAVIRKEGKFTLQGEPALMQELDALLGAFVEQGRMKLPGAAYEPCYSVEALS